MSRSRKSLLWTLATVVRRVHFTDCASVWKQGIDQAELAQQLHLFKINLLGLEYGRLGFGRVQQVHRSNLSGQYSRRSCAGHAGP